MRRHGWRLGGAAAAVALLVLVGCAGPDQPIEAATDPREAVVAVRLLADGHQVVQTGVSLGDGRVVTAASWRDAPPPNQRVEVLWGNQAAEAEVVQVEPGWGLALLRTRSWAPRASVPAHPSSPATG